MFKKNKKRPIISPPSNFEHRVHTGFDKGEGKYVGLPPQWASVVETAPRPIPIIDPDQVTPTSDASKVSTANTSSWVTDIYKKTQLQDLKKSWLFPVTLP